VSYVAHLAARNLWRAPGFTSVAVLSLTLGIAASTVIFSAFDAVMLQSVPVTEPAQLTRVFTTAPRAPQAFNVSSYPDYLDIRDSGVFESVAAFREVELSIDEAGVTDTLRGQLVSGNFFDVLGIRAAMGRTFVGEEDRADSPVRVTVLADAFWRSRYGADPSIIGRTIAVSGNRYTVIGVAPRGFGGVELGDSYDAWFPMALQPELRPPPIGFAEELGTTSILGFRAPRWLSVVGRLPEGAAAADVSVALDRVGQALAAEYPDSNTGMNFVAVPLGEGPGLRARNRPVLLLMFAGAMSVLLIACLNVASLLLARAITRRRDTSVRIAIGAGLANLARYWLVEAVMIGVLGAACGVALAYLSVPLLSGLSIPEGIDLGINARVLGFAAATGVVTGLIFGLAPFAHLHGRDVVAELNDRGALSEGSRSTRLRDAFVVLQIALSVVLLVGGGLLARTVQKAYAVDLGYDIESVLLADVNLEIGRYTLDETRAFYDELLGRLNDLPGVQSAAVARPLLTGFAATRAVSSDGQPIRPDRSNMLSFASNTVSEQYLATMGIPIVRGRNFEATDGPDSPRVTIVTESLADRLWPGAEPIGQTLAINPPAEVIGIVPDTVYASAIDADPPPFFYLPLRQDPDSLMTLHVRTAVDDPYAVLPALRQTLRSLDPSIAVARLRLLSDDLARSLAVQRSVASLAGAFSIIAAILAAVGLYGAMVYFVRQRISEIGLRMALGATSLSIMGDVVGRGARLLAVGAALGIGGATFGARFIESRLFGVEPTDAVTWLVVVAGVLVIGVLGCTVPAGQAMRTDPAHALRSA
jgi:predicted permease